MVEIRETGVVRISGNPAEASTNGVPQSSNPGSSTVRRVRGVLAIPAFRRLWIVSAICSMGDWLALLAQTALATHLTESYTAQSFAFGGVVAMKLLPAMVLAPLAGTLADRFDRRKVMVTCDILRAGIMLSIPLVGELWWLFVAIFLIEMCSLFWIPAKESSIPNLLRRPDQVETANQLSLAMTYGVSVITATGVFTLLSSVGTLFNLSLNSTTTVYTAMFINSLAFLTSAIVVATRIPEISGRRAKNVVVDDVTTTAGEAANAAVDGAAKRAVGGATAMHVDGAGKRPGVLRMLRDGIQFIGTTPLIRGLVLGIIGAMAAAGAVVGTSNLYSQSLSAGDAGYGMLFSAVFVGLALGMAVSPKLAQRVPHNRLFGSAIVCAGLALIPVALAPHLGISLAVVPLVGASAGVAFLTGLTIVGTQVEDEIRGRTVAVVQSLLRIVMFGALTLVPVLIGILGQRSLDFFGTQVQVDATRPILFGAGLVAVGLGVLAYRQMDDRRDQPIMADLREAFRSGGRRKGVGLLITIEGDAAVDTATQTKHLTDWLQSFDDHVVLANDPALDEGRLGRMLGSVELTGSRAHALVAAAVRSDVVEQVIRPALDSGAVVVMERYVDSPLAHFGAAGGLDQRDLEGLAEWATGKLRADVTVLLDRDPAQVGVNQRAEQQLGADHHWRVQNLLAEMAAANPDRYVVVDADGTEAEIAARVRTALEPMLRAKRGLGRGRGHEMSDRPADVGTGGTGSNSE
ncbi:MULTISPECIES: bifunctional MFS transporter/dTMP kinase [Actinoalloteichus]|uniref:Thymidylate kinase n=1 Tax=Actinoalloteichus fjordicus TaxID=1612552 RepID=A0AAC9PPS9_9PSEU|nr:MULTISPECIES: dTMP kinase [Actinoalloteichus]APU12380.1 thymidylate kinase [Actinoalloteichus fjordicus]APU18332.1 thymidylate kinase [Actinoalloteichus sp. GBA129-24]